jgi:acyl-CoA reductase-like NAD-dependent aldehyde dehydrogenase
MRDIGEVLAAAHCIASKIDDGREELIAVLTSYETWQTANDEIDRSIEALQNLELEASHIAGIRSRERLAVFLPINQPLYALVLFGVIPALMAEAVVVRPSAPTGGVVSAVYELVASEHLRRRLRVVRAERAAFVSTYVSSSSVTIFTGSLKNGSRVLQTMPAQSCFVFNGSGVNPIVVGPHADTGRAVEGIVRAVSYSSGQDCAAPDCILVHESQVDDVLGRLTTGLGRLRLGSNADPDTEVGPLYRTESLLEYVAFATGNRNRLISGGTVDVGQHRVAPTVFCGPLGESFAFPELYAPVANVAIYRDGETLRQFFASDKYQRRAMYATVYGEVSIEMPNTRILDSELVLDFENGNRPFGGLGVEASFYKIGSRKPRYGAVLVSEVLAAYSGEV